MIIDYDELIHDLLTTWEKEDDPLQSALKQGITSLIIPYIFKFIRENVLFENPIPLKISSTSRIKKLRKGLEHSLWYICWSLKWLILLFRMKKRKNLVFTSFFRNSKKIHQLLIYFCNAKEMYLFLNLGVLHNIGLLLNPNYYCYPYAIFKRKIKVPTLIDTKLFTILFRKFFNLDFYYTQELLNFSRILSNIYLTYSPLIKYFKPRHNCICLLQDCDYLAERVILNFIFHENNIPTITTDHSVMISKHFFKNCYSDYALTWGEYQHRRIIDYSSKQPQKIINIGRPVCSNKNLSFSQANTWVYFLPAFQEAHLQSLNRRLEDSIRRFNEILEYLKNIPKTKLIVKCHPSDDLDIFPFRSSITTKSLHYLANRCVLAFVEDSSISIELLQYNIPVIYFADRLNHDPLCIVNSNIDYTFCGSNEAANTVIDKVLKNTLGSRRKPVMEHYFSKAAAGLNILNIVGKSSEWNI